jgi:hypothetical protein
MNQVLSGCAVRAVIQQEAALPGRQRLHVWHPDLPRRDCYAHSGIHNHRFSFRSRVLVGQQKNVRVDLELARDGTHDIISHNGPRSDKGGRESYPVAVCNVHEREVETYGPGEEYLMPVHEYHHTPNDGIVVTIMQKIEESTIPAILGSYLRRGNIPRWLQRRVGEEFRKLGNSYEVAQ